jgi:hypothetical protein
MQSARGCMGKSLYDHRPIKKALSGPDGNAIHLRMTGLTIFSALIADSQRFFENFLNFSRMILVSSLYMSSFPVAFLAAKCQSCGGYIYFLLANH